MIKEIELRLSPSEMEDQDKLKNEIAAKLDVEESAISDYRILKKSIDARQRKVWINLRLSVALNGDKLEEVDWSLDEFDVSKSPSVIVVGTGPAGLFAALEFIENGIKPILIERGKNVRDRRRDLVKITREHEVDENSNYCFGEGGAGTYSDGKLYTRSGNKKQIRKILRSLVRHGANDNILVEAHPHIGTNKLPQIIVSIREYIIKCGGEIHFETKMVDILTEDNAVKGIVDQNGKEFLAEAIILATGHSARDVFQLLDEKKVNIEFKSFALGVRIEHPQNFIDKIQYHSSNRSEYLPPASYSLVTQVNEKGVYSFCMCPGGIIAPCATSPGEIVTNGWSPSKRNNPYANAGMVTQIEWDDIKDFHKFGEMAGLEFQKSVEITCWKAGGEKQFAPAQRLKDFIDGKLSQTLPECSYSPGVVSARLDEIMPSFIVNRLQIAFKEFEKKMKGFIHPEAIVVAPESRTSSPIRIVRDSVNLESPSLKGLYPCGEGAGFAGGIVSAAIDGKRVAEKCYKQILESNDQ